MSGLEPHCCDAKSCVLFRTHFATTILLCKFSQSRTFRSRTFERSKAERSSVPKQNVRECLVKDSKAEHSMVLGETTSRTFEKIVLLWIALLWNLG